MRLRFFNLRRWFRFPFRRLRPEIPDNASQREIDLAVKVVDLESELKLIRFQLEQSQAAERVAALENELLASVVSRNQTRVEAETATAARIIEKEQMR